MNGSLSGVCVGDDVPGRLTVQPATDSDAITTSTIIATNFGIILFSFFKS